MVQKLPLLSLKHPFLAKKIEESNQIFDQYIQNYSKEHSEKKLYLYKKLQDPLSIIYPFGNKVYNIAVMNPLTVTSVDRFGFEDIIANIATLIEKDAKILEN